MMERSAVVDRPEAAGDVVDLLVGLLVERVGVSGGLCDAVAGAL